MSSYLEDFDAKARTWDDPAKLERAAKVAEAIASQVPSLSSARVLEYGSGTGLLGFALQARAASVTLADASAEMTAVAREKNLARGADNVQAIQRLGHPKAPVGAGGRIRLDGYRSGGSVDGQKAQEGAAERGGERP